MVGRARAEARYRITAEDQTRSGLTSARNEFDRFDTSVTSLFTRLERQALRFAAVVGVGVAGLFALNRFARVGDELDKLATRLNTTTDEIARLRAVSELQGITFESLGSQLSQFQRNLGNVQSEEIRRAFAEFGIQPAALAVLDLNQQLILLSQRLERLPVERRARAIGQLFGEGNIGQLLNLGAERLTALFAEVGSLQGFRSFDQFAQASVNFRDSLVEFGAAFDAFLQTSGPVISALNNFAEAIRNLTSVFVVFNNQGIGGVLRALGTSNVSRSDFLTGGAATTLRSPLERFRAESDAIIDANTRVQQQNTAALQDLTSILNFAANPANQREVTAILGNN